MPGELYIGGVRRGARLPGPARADGGALRARPLRRAPGARLYRTGDLARCLPDGARRVPRPRRPPGEDPRLPHRARRDRGRARARTRRCARPWCWRARTRPGDKRLVAYVVAGRAARRRSARDAARVRCRSGCPSTWCRRRSCVLAALPLHAERQGRPAARCPRPTLARGARARRAARAPSRRPSPASSPRCCGRPGSRRARTTASSSWAGTRSWRRRSSRACAATFGVELPLRALFEAPTPAALAARVEAALRSGRGRRGAAHRARAARRARRRSRSRRSGCGSSHQLEPDDASYLVPLGAPPRRRARSRRARARARRARAAPRGAAHALRAGGRQARGRRGRGLPARRCRRSSCRRCPRPSARPRCGTRSRRSCAAPSTSRPAPPLRAQLFALGDEEHVLLVAIHHIVTDGWSMGVLRRELGALYEAFHAGQALAAAGAAGPVRRLRRVAARVADGRGARAAARLLEGAPRRARPRRSSCRPTGRARRCTSHRGAAAPLRARRRSSRGALAALARREGATLFMMLLAAFDVLLPRYTGQRDVVVGTPIAGRTRAETEGLIGFFVNTLALRAAIRRRRAVPRRCSRGCARRASAPTRTRTCPSSGWWRSSRPARDLSRTPLFQVMLALQNAPRESPARAGLRAARRGRGERDGEVRSDARRSARRRAGSPAASSTRPISSTPATIERMLGHLRVLLEGVVGRPRARRSASCRCSRDEERAPAARRRGTTRRRATRDATPACTSSSRRRSDRDARTRSRCVAGAERLSYRELDARANRLAHHLRRLGVGPERAGRPLRASARSELVVGAARHPQGGRRLRAARSGLPGGAPRASCSRTRARPCWSPTRRARAGAAGDGGAARVLLDADADADRRPRTRGAARARGARPARPRLRDLHLGLDGPAEGRGDRAPRGRRASCAGRSGVFSPARARAASLLLDVALLRPLGLRALRAARRRRRLVILADDALSRCRTRPPRARRA